MNRAHATAIYHGIKSRCCNKNNVSYPQYGGKGIGICDEWLRDKEAFVLWLEYSGWESGCEIHRQDATKDYSPENCVVMRKKDHQNSTRKNASPFVAELHAIGMTAKELAARWGVTQRQISNVGKNPSPKDLDALEGIKKEVTAKKKQISP
jgi:hypothetical protein